ncbi:MAG TPA: dTMP kinase [Streptosporangiaceae bacterium]|nr:dTMP kinase [Streptosporangiaceae bacterium]
MILRAPANRERRGVLSIKPFRRLWIALALSSLGDWLSILALTALAFQITQGRGVATQSYAVGGVWIATLLPALLLGPLAGAAADRLDRRMTMIVGDVIRGVLFLSIPLFPNLTWIFVAKFLAGCASVFWTPAKDASVPNLVPPDRLERANQLSLFTTYGSAVVAGVLFSLLALVSKALGSISPYFNTNQVNLALYFNAATFGVSAVTVFFLRIPKRQPRGYTSAPSVARMIWEGWRFLGYTPVVRGLVIGMVGAFAAAGVIIGIGKPYITDTLHGGNAGWGTVFVAIFIGLALGMFLGSRVLKEFSRRRLFGLSIAAAGIPLALMALIPNLVVLTFLVVVLGGLAGIAYATGYTIVGLEVEDSLRGRTFAFLQSAIQVILLTVVAASTFVSAAITKLVHGATGSDALRVGGVAYNNTGDNILLLLAAAVAVLLGVVSYQRMDDRRGIPLVADLLAAIRGEPISLAEPKRPRGLLLALEGGEGAGKTTQARLLGIWLRDQGYEVVATQEPGATKVGMRLRALLLDKSHTGLSARAETLMYAADRAEHVASVIQPALDRGAIVITDRYVDSSLAYQGAGRQLPVEDVARLNRWATGGMMPDLTILLDLPPSAGLSRRAPSADRLESEPIAFHERVRRGFRALAAAQPDRYLVADATLPPEQISRQLQERIREILPDPVPAVAEAVTGSFPAVRD